MKSNRGPKEIDFRIEKLIYVIQGQKVMVDTDLAKLYGVETGAFNRQVHRNIKRFPSDFIFQLNKEEYENLRCQFGISSTYGGRRYLPYVFTEYGIAALSGILSSNTAINVNISIIRTFIRLRKLLATDESLAIKLQKLEHGTGHLFRIIFKRLDDLEAVRPILPQKRKKIGLK
ncbi:MAG: ORF6N domain-containing protein [Pseudomonadota bacterium]